MSHSLRKLRSALALVVVSALPAGGIFGQAPAGSDVEALKARVEALEQRLGAAESAVTAGIDRHPFVQTKDGKFKVEFRGRVQARYTYQGRDSRGDDDSNISDRSFFELERLRFGIEGYVWDPAFYFIVESDGHTDEGTLELTDAYVQYQRKDKDRGFDAFFGIGQWKPYFGRQEKTSSGAQLFVDRSLANEFFNIDRNVGVWVESRKTLNKDEKALFNGVAVELAVTNGIDSVNVPYSDGETDQIPAFIAHVDLDVLGNLGRYALTGGDYNRIKVPGLTIGASFMSDQNNGSGNVDDANAEWDVYQMAFDFVFKYMGFSLNGEYFGRWLDFDSEDVGPDTGEQAGIGEAVYSQGAYVDAGMMLTEKLQVMGRVSAIWNTEGPARGNAVEAGGGVNYFLNQHNLKLSLDVLYYDIPSEMPTMTERLPGLAADDSGAGGDPFTHAAFSSSAANLEEFQGIMVRAQVQLGF
jgi:hypothetical protein